MGDSTQAWKREKISNEDIEKAKILMSRFPMNVFTHYPFCANLAGQSQKGCLAWSGNVEVDRKLKPDFFVQMKRNRTQIKVRLKLVSCVYNLINHFPD
jgi:hypothetical protein